MTALCSVSVAPTLASAYLGCKDSDSVAVNI